MLQYSYPVIALVEAVLNITAAVGKLTDVPSFKIGTGRQYNIGKPGFTLVSDGLVYNEFQVFRLIHSGIPVAVAHCAEM